MIKKELHIIGYALTDEFGKAVTTGDRYGNHRTKKIYSSKKIAESSYKKTSYFKGTLQ